jgi:hypothetical protein
MDSVHPPAGALPEYFTLSRSLSDDEAGFGRQFQKEAGSARATVRPEIEGPIQSVHQRLLTAVIEIKTNRLSSIGAPAVARR